MSFFEKRCTNAKGTAISFRNNFDLTCDFPADFFPHISSKMGSGGIQLRLPYGDFKLFYYYGINIFVI